jgi:hypothetical protein
MSKLKNIEGKDFNKSFGVGISCIAFCSRELKCEANLNSIKNKLGLSNDIMNRLDKLKIKSEKKGSGIVSNYIVELEDEVRKFDENDLDNMEFLIDVWDDYMTLNKSYNLLVNECIELLEKQDNLSESKKIGFFFNLFKKKFKNDLENVELKKMKDVNEKSKNKISSEAHKIKKYLVNIGEDSEGSSLFPFLRCSVSNLLELRNEIKLKNKEKYIERIDLLMDFVEYWDN